MRMLEITIPGSPGTEYWDENKEEFIQIAPVKEQTLQLEHSLVSLSKWESKWHKPFLNTRELTFEENLDYIKCMTLTKNVDPKVYSNLTKENIDEIVAYIKDPMTATTISGSGDGKKEVLTSEVIYYYMAELRIPFNECQKWHLNRLLTLIQVFGAKNSKQKPMTQKEIIDRNRALNEARRKQLKSKG